MAATRLQTIDREMAPRAIKSGATTALTAVTPPGAIGEKERAAFNAALN